jgi:hypothetical protein
MNHWPPPLVCLKRISARYEPQQWPTRGRTSSRRFLPLQQWLPLDPTRLLLCQPLLLFQHFQLLPISFAGPAHTIASRQQPIPPVTSCDRLEARCQVYLSSVVQSLPPTGASAPASVSAVFPCLEGIPQHHPSLLPASVCRSFCTLSQANPGGACRVSLVCLCSSIIIN